MIFIFLTFLLEFTPKLESRRNTFLKKSTPPSLSVSVSVSLSITAFSLSVSLNHAHLQGTVGLRVRESVCLSRSTIHLAHTHRHTRCLQRQQRFMGNPCNSTNTAYLCVCCFFAVLCLARCDWSQLLTPNSSTNLC